MYKSHCYDHSKFGNIKYPFCSFVGGKLTKSVFVFLTVFSFCLFFFGGGIIDAVLLHLLNSTVHFRDRNKFLSFNFYIFLYIYIILIFYMFREPQIIFVFKVSNFKVIEPLNYEKYFDHVWQYRIHQYGNVILAKLVVLITLLIYILVFWSIMSLRLPAQISICWW